MPFSAAIVSAALALLLLSGCGENETETPSVTAPPNVPKADRRESGGSAAIDPGELPPRLSCPEGSDNCASARGRILYVEAVDPDGDGDAHFVLESPEAITLPGITVIDVGLHLRPEPLPQPGDYLSAVGPVYRGSYGQAQIEATAIRFARQARQP